MDKLNPGVVKLVVWLNANGFKTIDSGDGATHDYECDRAIPYVAITVEADKMVAEGRRLARLLLEMHKITVEPMNAENDKPCIQCTFDPGWGEAGLIDLTNVSDALLAFDVPLGNSTYSA